jgi:hypothetical protein
MTRFAIYNIIVIAALLAASGCSKSTGPAAARGVVTHGSITAPVHAKGI